MAFYEGKLSTEDSMQFTSYSDKLFRCNDIRTLNTKHNSSELIGQLRVAISYKMSKLWYQCYWNGIEYLDIITDYLRLNTTFIEPTGNRWSTLKMVNNSEADYLLDGQENYQGLLEQFSNLIIIGTEGYHKLNFLLRKKTIQFSVGSYLNVFNSLIWMLTFISILFISGIISPNVSRQNQQKKSFWNLNFNLIFDYLNMLMTKHP